jgi:DNA-binding NtrC family response regulator
MLLLKKPLLILTMAKQYKILVVEDEAPLSDALCAKLTHEGYEVTGIRNGELGLNSALNSHPDLIVLDMIMPHMGGIEMLKLLRRDGWGYTVPVIILTNVGNIEESPQVISDPHLSVHNKSETKLEDLVIMIRETLKDK